MDSVLNDPAFVVVSLTLASALLLIEIALPTFGIAGITGTGLGIGGLIVVARQHHPWWPLVLIALAVCLWAVLLVRRAAPPRAQALAVGLYELGGIGYGVLAHDAPTVAV